MRKLYEQRLLNNDEYVTAVINLFGEILIIDAHPYSLSEGYNGSGELYGLNSNGKYFVVPCMVEKEYLTILGSTIDEFYDEANAWWGE